MKLIVKRTKYNSKAIPNKGKKKTRLNAFCYKPLTVNELQRSCPAVSAISP